MCHVFGVIVLTISFLDGLCSVNHFKLKDNFILPTFDSPFFMREPENLIAFLDQIRYNDNIESSYRSLMYQREQIVEHLKFSVQYGEGLVEEANCAMDYFIMEKKMSYLKVSPTALSRLELDLKDLKYRIYSDNRELLCGNDNTILSGPSGYAHLESFQNENILQLRMEKEQDPSAASLTIEELRLLSLTTDNLNSWKYYTIASYYYRMRGNAQKAIDCARKAVVFSPRSHKDIPLLSLGTILFRSGRLNDADIILTAAVDHALENADNCLTLASALAMKHDFKRSLYYFDEAERLDPSLLPRTLPIRNFIQCLDNLSKKTQKMYSYVEYMKSEVNEFKKLKYQISQHHEKLVQQQIPLAARYLDAKTPSPELLKRGQYCSTRTLPEANEPVLFCDFYSDMQMRLESNDVDIESLERDLKLTSDAVIKQVSVEFRKQLNVDNLKSTSGQIPEVHNDDIINTKKNTLLQIDIGDDR